ncbi:MAG: hypothetical protein UU47_C0001G0014 [candidate division TM6 bacterium GW2011_GWE2_41_16]|nr:MAG: hypothetical protein UU47_C0001G0014 [candidate division TM6 bacterium GW2011_GWE2_41_16]
MFFRPYAFEKLRNILKNLIAKVCQALFFIFYIEADIFLGTQAHQAQHLHQEMANANDFHDKTQTRIFYQLLLCQALDNLRMTKNILYRRSKTKYPIW